MQVIKRVLVVACILLKARAAEPSCPVCSKYHYDEMVLERMIRNEIKWEQIVNDIKAINDKVNSALQVIDEASLKTEHFKLILEKQKHAVDDASVQIENLTLGLEKQKQVVDEVSVKTENLTSGLEKQKLDVDMIKIRSQNFTNVLFYARTPENTGSTIVAIAIFTRVGVNTGQGYDPDTGKFKAPVSGVYMFAVQYCTEANKWGCLAIVKNGTALQSSVNIGGSGPLCTSMQTFTTVPVGEQVWVQYNHGWGGNCNLYEHDYFVSSFAGVLLHT